jgi:hypothetical protein
MLGSARQRRLRPAAVAFALGEAIKLQHHIDIIGQQQRLDLAAQTAQAERHDGRPQLGCSGDVAPSPLVEGDAVLQPLLANCA